MRVTSGMIMRRYSSRLNDVLSSLNDANEKVTTNRKFNKGYENPAESAKSKLLRREYAQNEDYKSNVKDAQSRYEAVESCMMNMNKSLVDAYVDITNMLNGTNGPGEREIVAKKLEEIQKTLVKEANTKFGDQYIFGGANTKGDAPFVFDESTKKLTFRGVDVDSAANAGQLKDMANEQLYVDLGFGLTFEDQSKVDPDNPNQIVSGSAYNIAMPGIKFLGHVDEDGNTNNVITTLGELADALRSPNFSAEGIKPLTDKFDSQRQLLLTNVTALGANTKFLEYTTNRLETNDFNLTKKINDVEFIDPAQAIMDFKAWDTTYRAALQSGMEILSVSFIDFMR